MSDTLNRIGLEWIMARDVIGAFIRRECCQVNDAMRDQLAAELIAVLAQHDPPLLIGPSVDFSWLDEPTVEGWYWVQGRGAAWVRNAGTSRKPKWLVDGAGGARPLSDRKVAPCVGRPE